VISALELIKNLGNPLQKFYLFAGTCLLYSIFEDPIMHQKQRAFLSKMVDAFNNKSTLYENKKINLTWFIASTGLFQTLNKKRGSFVFSTQILQMLPSPIPLTLPPPPTPEEDLFGTDSNDEDDVSCPDSPSFLLLNEDLVDEETDLDEISESSNESDNEGDNAIYSDFEGIDSDGDLSHTASEVVNANQYININ